MMSNVEQVEKWDMPNFEIVPKTEIPDSPEQQEHESGEILNSESEERKPFVGLEGELDFEDEALYPVKVEKTEDQNSAPNETDVQHTETSKTIENHEKEDGECVSEKLNEKAIEDEDDGECSDEDDLEEGELKDQDETPKEKQRQVCRFFNRGVCFYGLQCRFLHLNSDLKGNYNMFAPTSRTYDPTIIGNVIVPTGQLGIMHNQHRSSLRSGPDFLPGPPVMPSNHPEFPEESAWERGLKEAKELVKKASKRKLDPDFENKRLNLGLNANEKNIEINDKENDGKYQKKKKDEKKSDLFKYDPPYCDVPYDRDPRGQYERRFENFEIRYTDRASGERCGRGLEKKTRRKSPERIEREKTSRFGQRDWRNDRIEATKEGRGEAYFDPWRRSKSPKNRRSRDRSRSFGSYSSVSSYSSRSSCSYSRSSSRSSRECSSRRDRSPVYSRSSRSSRSISMDSVSSASSSISHSTSGESLITPEEQNALLRAQAENPPVKIESIPGHPPGGLFFQSKKFDKITIGLKNPEYDPLEEKFQNSLATPEAPFFPTTVHNPIPGAEKERAKESIKSLHPPKQQIKLTLLNKNPQSKLSNLPKKDLELNRVVQTDETTKLGGFNVGVNRPVTPPPPPPPGVLMKPVPPPAVVPKKSASSRRDELLKQLKAVEDAIARKRAKFC